MEPFTILSAEARVPLGPFAIENNLPAREGLTRCPSAFLRVGHRQVTRQLHGCFFSLDCLRSARRKPEKEHGHETVDHGLAYRPGCGAVAGD